MIFGSSLLSPVPCIFMMPFQTCGSNSTGQKFTALGPKSVKTDETQKLFAMYIEYKAWPKWVVPPLDACSCWKVVLQLGQAVRDLLGGDHQGAWNILTIPLEVSAFVGDGTSEASFGTKRQHCSWFPEQLNSQCGHGKQSSKGTSFSTATFETLDSLSPIFSTGRGTVSIVSKKDWTDKEPGNAHPIQQWAKMSPGLFFIWVFSPGNFECTRPD